MSRQIISALIPKFESMLLHTFFHIPPTPWSLCLPSIHFHCHVSSSHSDKWQLYIHINHSIFYHDQFWQWTFHMFKPIKGTMWKECIEHSNIVSALFTPVKLFHIILNLISFRAYVDASSKVQLFLGIDIHHGSGCLHYLELVLVTDIHPHSINELQTFTYCSLLGLVIAEVSGPGSLLDFFLVVWKHCSIIIFCSL